MFHVLLMALALGGAAPDEASASSTSAATGGFVGLTPLQTSDLGAVRAGQSTTVNGAFSTTTLTAANSGNTINAGSVNTGAVNLGSDAFGGFAGLGNFVINTGNNNNLQGSLTVTVLMAPGLTR